MTTDQIILFALFGGVFAMLLWGRFRYDIVAFSALLLGVILGVVPKEDAFLGFGHPATLVVALVLIVSAGLVRSGAVLLITRTLVDAGRGVGRHIAIMGGIGAVLSAFMNNVAALALLMPVDIATARKAGRLPGKTLMPLSYATILGGTVTLIGTPPNIVIAGIRRDQLGESFAMFDFAPVGLVTTLAGLIFVAVLGWRLIPDPEGAQAQGGAVADQKARFVAELTVPEGNRRVGQKVNALYETADETNVHIIGLLREGRRMFGSSRDVTIQAGDALVLEADPDALDEFRASESLEFSDDRRMTLLDEAEQGLSLIEVVVRDDSRINGKSAQAIGLAWRQRTVLMGISRRGRRITERLRRERIQAGDILLLLAPAEQAEEVVDWLGALPLADRGLAVTDNKKVWPAVGAFAAAVAAASFGMVDLTVALGVVVTVYVVARIVPLHQLYDSVEWPVVVLLGSMIPLGSALETSGGTELIAGWLGALTAGQPAWVAMLLLMVVTMVLSAVLNNTATAIVAAPVGIQMARALNVNPDAFLIAVAVAASCAFLTPIGHKNNTLILGPGGYRFGDYWQMGLPLTLVILAVSLPATLFFWPL
ncbi:SLC13 family permease [Jannaschia rubra]|uniref:Potassium transporter peripheral membrane component n=1 Tax=Jannaschia rubra TaxID=282197 RepID=A0A0M6XKM7_9RHOB|nr:SLC13 family permease [Jannaschia rubra]CTQ31740.1 potassium transporter peripheral membrane component [Jannaschia rubra]SFG55091.1 Di-and tricarboxylate transporter [Jannaschia rubra]